MFEKRGSLLNLWQTIAENFYPERADFTAVRNVGDSFADNLSTSYPILARRDLGNSIGAMLRPSSKDWFKIVVRDMESVDKAGKEWLEWASSVQKRAMHDRDAMFTRATKEGDHDFAAFGQCCITAEVNQRNASLLYRSWHLRDVAWQEDEIGRVGTLYRKWKPTCLDLERLFGDKIHQKVREKLEKKPYDEINVWHCVVPAETASGDYKPPLVSVYYDRDNDHIMEEVGIKTMPYTVPRWQTVSGSQYAYSPATVAALPDARLIQAMTAALLDAGEKAVTPPMLATQEAIRSDISLFPGGITWVDSDYDERLGEVLRPISSDIRGLPFGLEMQQDLRQMIAEAFYLNKLSLPSDAGEMTAYETGQRVQEYIRQALPIFEPIEADYNGALCEKTFDLLLAHGAFGSPEDIPKSLRGRDVEFQFESPLKNATERSKGARMLEAQQLLAQTIPLDKTTAYIMDAGVALRDALEGIGVQAKWTRSEAEVQKIVAAEQEAMQAQQALTEMQQGSEIARNLKDVNNGV